MSSSWIFHCFVGVKIKLSSIYNTEVSKKLSCEHDHKAGDQYCSTCGKRIDKSKTETQTIKPEILQNLGVSETAFEDYGWGVVDNLEMDFLLIEDWENPSEDIILCGKELGNGCEQEPRVSKGKVPRIPTEEDIAKFLEKMGIDHYKRSFGLWNITTRE